MKQIVYNLLILMLLGATALLLQSCDSIYDDPSDVVRPGTDQPNTYSYIDATDYIHWIYLDLKTGKQVTLPYTDTQSIPAQWQLALHRYDCKTNGGRVFETEYTDLDALKAAAETGTFARPSNDRFTPDEADSIIVDVSTMMQGYLTYAKTLKNTVLGRWLNVDMRTMPPVYTPSNKVYLLLTGDGTMAAIRFTGYANPNKYNAKGYISLKYVYPLTFKN